MRDPRLRVALHAMISVALGALALLLWLVTGLGDFWPAWVWFGLACTLGLHVVGEYAAPVSEQRWWRLHVALTALVVFMLVAVWALAGPHTAWLAWPVLTLLVLLAIHRFVADQPPADRAQGLVDRVEELTRSRRGAVDAQAEELRRIERDLHDGAQARLVAQTMRLGRARQRLGDDADPQLVELLEAAQDDSRAAIAELRDLARGIAPPVLSDRGLTAAVAALAERSPLEVSLESDVPGRLPPAVERAGYFVAAESLTNAAKHAPGATVSIVISVSDQQLHLQIGDDGPGGADAAGGGLIGLRQRIEALDVTLRVADATPGPGTVLTAQVPCAS